MGRRAKPKHLSAAETERFLKAATELHSACRRPMLSVLSEDYRALNDLSIAICATIQRLGHELPWVSYGHRMPDHRGPD